MKKELLQKTKTTINILFPFFILESLFLNTCYLGPKTLKKQVIFIFL